jgi:hypothetical protein
MTGGSDVIGLPTGLNTNEAIFFSFGICSYRRMVIQDRTIIIYIRRVIPLWTIGG